MGVCASNLICLADKRLVRADHKSHHLLRAKGPGHHFQRGVVESPGVTPTHSVEVEGQKPYSPPFFESYGTCLLDLLVEFRDRSCRVVRYVLARPESGTLLQKWFV